MGVKKMDEKNSDEKILLKRAEDLKDLIRRYKPLKIILWRIMTRLRINDNEFKTTLRNDNSLRLQDINRLSPNTYSIYFGYLVAERFLVPLGVKTNYNISPALIFFFVKYPEWLDDGSQGEINKEKTILNITEYDWNLKKSKKGKNKK
jgi:hypothetical protein